LLDFPNQFLVFDVKRVTIAMTQDAGGVGNELSQAFVRVSSPNSRDARQKRKNSVRVTSGLMKRSRFRD
jgi:hypothetical protein